MATLAPTQKKHWLSSYLRKQGVAPRMGCPVPVLMDSKLRLRGHLDITPPHEFFEVLEGVNGFVLDDIILFYVVNATSDDPAVASGHVATEVTANNLHYRNSGMPSHYFVCGTTSDALMTYDSNTSKFVTLDPYGFEAMRIYTSLREMLTDLLPQPKRARVKVSSRRTR